MMKIRDYSLTFVGGDTQSLQVAGNFFRVLEAANAIQVEFDDSPKVTREEGQAQIGDYTSIRITSAAPQSIRVSAGFGNVTDNRQTVNVAVTTNLDPAAVVNDITEVTVAAGATALVLAANVDRKRCMFQSSMNNDPTIIARLGGATVSATKGLEFVAGVSTPHFMSTAAYYVHNPGAAAIKIMVYEDEQ